MLVILFINGELCRNGSETLPRVGHIRTQVDLYQYQHSRLPFDDAEAGTVTTWRKRDDGLHEPIHFDLKANANREPVAATFHCSAASFFFVPTGMKSLVL